MSIRLKDTIYDLVNKANSVAWGNITSKPTFATVATSGSYNDLDNKPDLSKYALSSSLTNYQTKITTTNKLDYSLISGTPTSLPASDVYEWAKASTKPSYTWNEIVEKPTKLSSFTDDIVSGKYLSLSGGTMTGSISYPLEYMNNIRDLASSCVFDYTTELAAKGSIDNKRSLMGYCHNVTWDSWWNLISVRGDSDKYGMYIVSSMTEFDGNLSWNRQEGWEGAWQGERVILDSANWSQYVTLGGNPTYEGMLTVNGSDYRSGYPAIRLHIPNVNWQQFLMRGDGVVELRYGTGNQTGTYGLMVLRGIYLQETNGGTVHFVNGEYMNQYGNFVLPSSSSANSWNVCNNNLSSLFAVYADGNASLVGNLSVSSLSIGGSQITFTT